jgi:hypothetical protein
MTVENNTFETLKMTVNRLIMDFENEEGVNKVEEFS